MIEKVRYIVMHLYGTLFAGFENIKKLEKCDPPSFLGSFYIRESSFTGNMTKGGDEDIETRSLKF